MANTYGLAMYPSGVVSEFIVEIGSNLREIADRLADDVHVVHLVRPDDEQIAVGWYSRRPQAVNEPATSLCRSLGAIHALDSLRGVFLLTGMNDDGKFGPPPAWASDAAYRFSKQHRDRLAPKPRWPPQGLT